MDFHDVSGWHLFGIALLSLLLANVIAYLSDYCVSKYMIASITKLSKTGHLSKTPVTILTGALGSGKTTAVNHILVNEKRRKIAVVVNELGSISIDHELIAKELTTDLFLLKNGCVCCIAHVKRDLPRILGQLADLAHSQKLDYVIVETTGVADPAPIIRTFLCTEIASSRFYLDGIVCCVDLKHYNQHILRNETSRQLIFSDMIVLNKRDLVSDSEVKQVKTNIAKINAFAKQITSKDKQFPLDDILDIQAFSANRIEALSQFEEPIIHTKGTQSLSLELGEVNLDAMMRILRALTSFRAQDVFRIKGLLLTNEKCWLLHGVHQSLFAEPLSSILKKSRIVIIGKNLDLDDLKKQLKSCEIEK